MKRAIATALAILGLTGCATRVTVEDANRMSTYQLCEALLLGRINPPDLFESQLRGRGESCEKYVPMVALRQQQRANESAALFQASQLLLQQQAAPPALAPIGSGFMRPLRNQWIYGGNQMCQYSDGTVMNMGIGICPLQLR